MSRNGNLNLSDRVLLLTFLRTYRYMDIGVPLDLRRVQNGPPSWWAVIMAACRVSMSWEATGLPVVRSGGMKDRYAPWYYLTPGISTGGQWSASGPNGNTYLARIVDIFTVFFHLPLRFILKMYCRAYYSLPFVEKHPHGVKTPEDLFTYLGKEKIGSVGMEFKRSGIGRKPWTRRRLTFFTDGAGK